jgi:site-specific DNA recombinase
MKTKNAILFARVSTKDQEDFGHSLPAQLRKLTEYAERHNFQIIKEFSFSESAGSKIRKKFEEVIRYLRTFKAGEMPILLCQNVDRVTRNFKDAVDLDEMRRAEGLEIHFVQDGFIISSKSNGNDLFMWEAKVFIAKQYLNRLTDDAVRSMNHKLENGECITKAPIGYLNCKDDKGQSTVKLDEERFMYIRRIFTEYSTGIYSLRELTKKVAQWGLKTKSGRKLSNSQVHALIQNRFYYGVLEYKGKFYQHHYTHIITEEIYNKCQNIRNGSNKKPIRYSEKPFVFRGLVKCGHCGCSYTSEMKKGKYVYMCCSKTSKSGCEAPRVREEQVFNQLAEVFDNMAFPSHIMADIRKHLQESHESKKQFHNSSLKSLKNEHNQIQNKLDILLDALLNESITRDEHAKKAYELKQRQQEINTQLSNFDGADEEFTTSLKLLLDLVQNAGLLFKSSNLEQKRKLINLVFQNLILKGGNVDYTLVKPFELFLDKAKCSKWLGW